MKVFDHLEGIERQVNSSVLDDNVIERVVKKPVRKSRRLLPGIPPEARGSWSKLEIAAGGGQRLLR
jgi:hypothetical protein